MDLYISYMTSSEADAGRITRQSEKSPGRQLTGEGCSEQQPDPAGRLIDHDFKTHTADHHVGTGGGRSAASPTCFLTVFPLHRLHSTELRRQRVTLQEGLG